MGVEVPLPDDIGPNAGILTDGEIIFALERGFLFENGTYDTAKAKYASYEIRVGTLYEILRFEGDRVSYAPIEVSDGECVTIPPGATLLINATEQFRIPTNVFAKITTVGQIFSSGLAAENTFADPGYSGPLYVTLSNVSTRVLSIRPGDPLARVEFHRLSRAVDRPHPGFQGRRPSFVTASVDTTVRTLLQDKTIKELIDELVSRSVDEAMHARFVRSEIILEKAYNEISTLKDAQAEVRHLRLMQAILVFLLSLLFIYYFEIYTLFAFSAIINNILAVITSFAASVIFYFVEKRFLTGPKAHV